MPSVDLEGAVSSLVGGSNPEGRSKYGSIVFYKQLKWATTHLNTSIQLGDNEEGIYVLTLAYSHPADYFMRTPAITYLLKGDTGLDSVVDLFSINPYPDLLNSTRINSAGITGNLIGYFEESVQATINFVPSSN